MEYQEKDLIEALVAQRNEALNNLAAANAVIAQMLREREAAKPKEKKRGIS